ncbi:MAG: hypothetical protein N2Z81_01880 [Hydrogenothermaceae bacterium]|nr:hypothetical protein [Hydrogenothermaceae bacterium]
MKRFIAYILLFGFLFNLFHDYLLSMSKEADKVEIVALQKSNTDKSGKNHISEIHSNLHVPYIDFVPLLTLKQCQISSEFFIPSPTKIKSEYLYDIFKPPRISL